MHTELYIGGAWHKGHGERFASYDPATGDKVWEGAAASEDDVAEAMAALVLAEAVLEKFGGDSVQEVRRNYESYMKNLRFK